MSAPQVALGASARPATGLGGRVARVGIVVVLHVLAIGFLLTAEPRVAPETGLLRMEVRTLPEPARIDPPRQDLVPPKPLPQASRPRPASAPAPASAPLLTAAPDAQPAAASFQVAPAPPAPPAAVSAVPVAPPVPAVAPVPVTAARFDADYLQNPPPVYPPMSRRLREEGRVLLLVRVSAQGLADGVQVRQSSGFERLDEAALSAVRQWRFVPARRGEETISATVLVPLVFRLE